MSDLTEREPCGKASRYRGERQVVCISDFAAGWKWRLVHFQVCPL